MRRNTKCLYLVMMRCRRDRTDMGWSGPFETKEDAERAAARPEMRHAGDDPNAYELCVVRVPVPRKGWT